MKLVIATLLAMSAYAGDLELVYTGTFNSQDTLGPLNGKATAFTTPTSFTIDAWFDTSTPDLAPLPPGSTPFAGFRAYDPSLVTLSVGGKTYDMTTYGQNSTVGVTVAVFDQNSFTPGHYAVGILQNPVGDGAGIIGDFLGASPGFTASDIVPTMFTGYYGVGYGSGVCLKGPSDDCQLNAVTPLILSDGLGNMFDLTLGNYDEDYPSVHFPGDLVGPLNTAELLAAPEPATLGIAGLALAGLALLCRKNRRS